MGRKRIIFLPSCHAMDHNHDPTVQGFPKGGIVILIAVSINNYLIGLRVCLEGGNLYLVLDLGEHKKLLRSLILKKKLLVLFY